MLLDAFFIHSMQECGNTIVAFATTRVKSILLTPTFNKALGAAAPVSTNPSSDGKQVLK